MIYVDEETVREYGDKTLDRELYCVLWDHALIHDDVVKFGGYVWLVNSKMALNMEE